MLYPTHAATYAIPSRQEALHSKAARAARYCWVITHPDSSEAMTDWAFIRPGCALCGIPTGNWCDTCETLGAFPICSDCERDIEDGALACPRCLAVRTGAPLPVIHYQA